MSLSAAIFDLDGTLIDSEGVYQASDRAFLARHGVELTPQESAEYIGLDSREIVRRLIDRHGIDGDADVVLAEKNRMFLDAAEGEVRAFPSILRLAELLADSDFSLAIATATPVAIRERMVELCGLAPLFAVRVSADEVEQGKPAPDVYLEAARRMGALPSDCVVIEDSTYGVEGAKAAGMRVVAVPTHLESPAFANVDLLVPGGAEALDPTEVYEWIRNR
jgi:HAD superfamily hydrolase (TIGR01509 family)